MARKKEASANPFVPTGEQPYKVPDNWCWVTIGVIASVKGGKRVPKGKQFVEYKTEHPYIRVTDFDNLSIATEQVRYIDEETFNQIRNYTISTRDIYISIAGTIGKVGIIPDILNGANLTENAAKITDIRGIKQTYLLWFLESEIAQSQMKDSTISTTQPKLALFRIENVKIPLSPGTEQQRIVTRIESLFAKLDEAKEKAQAVVDGFELRKSAILHKAFTGELTERWRKEHPQEKIEDRYLLNPVADSECPCELPMTWKWVRMGSLGYTNIGLTYRPSDKSEYGTIVLRSSNIQNGQIDYQDIVKVSMDIPENKMAQKGDILICARNGSKALVGKVAIVDKDGMSYGAFMAIFRSEFNPAIYYFFNSPFFRNIIDKDVGTTTINQVTQAIIKNLPYPLAPKAEQDEIVRILDSVLTKEQQAKEAAEAVLAQIDTMKKAILARAFRGELGTNDPAEESAAELVKSLLFN